jgi:hypothetical protein
MKIFTTMIFVLTQCWLVQIMPAQNPADAVSASGGIAATAGILGTPFHVVAAQLAGGGTVVGAPYSAVAITETTQTLADGSHIVHNSSATVYRDSQGRERREDPLPALPDSSGTGQASPKAIFISDPVAGTNYMLDANSHTAHRMPLPSQLQRTGDANTFFVNGVTISAGLLPPPPAGGPTMIFRAQGSVSNLPAPQIEQLGSSTIEGVTAEGTRSTTTIPVGQAGNDRELQIVDERWYSPDLKVTVLSRHSDPRMGETVYRLTQISRAEPAASMFEVPPDYTVTDGPAVMKYEKIQSK